MAGFGSGELENVIYWIFFYILRGVRPPKDHTNIEKKHKKTCFFNICRKILRTLEHCLVCSFHASTQNCLYCELSVLDLQVISC